MRRLRSVLGLVLLAALVGGPGAAAPRGELAPTNVSPLLDQEEDCLEPAPQTAGVSGVTDGGEKIALTVTVLLDDLPRARAEEVMTKAAESYAPINIDLKVAAYKRIRIPGDPPRPDGMTPSLKNTDIFRAIKDAVGGKRPEGSDLVHLLTSKDVYYIDQGQPAYSLAGEADCIGGVRYPQRAFAFSEGSGEYQEGSRDMSGIIAAHELGHLMGAHHHYGNCGQGSPVMQENETPCTVMFPFVIVWNAGNFGTLEGAVVRGHAVDFASP